MNEGTGQRRTIGVDLGATTVKSGVVDSRGRILRQVVADTRANEGPEIVVRQILSTIQSLLTHESRSDVGGVGIGAPGVVSLDGNTVEYPPNFSNWTSFELGSTVSTACRLPVHVENDANVAAIAEAKFGAGIDEKDFIFVIWGTGVGGGIIVDRKIFRGPHGGAGEIGHMSIDHNGPRCNCGNHGCIECYIGQRYLSQRTKEILEQSHERGKPSLIERLVDGNLDAIEPKVISTAAQQGDPIARAILEEAGRFLGYALAAAINLLDVRVAVIGGGISASPDFVFDAIQSGARSRALKSHQPHIRILRAKLGNAAGIIGAASLVM
ncbi:MAG: ROK family protein [Bacteroidota bacterium]|jgi:glucokinase